jgi:hypothetical protein
VKNLTALSKQYTADPLSVTAADWDSLVKGSQGKLRWLYGKKYPREKWPAGVPYLNLIALRQHRDRKKMQNAAKVLPPSPRTDSKGGKKRLRSGNVSTGEGKTNFVGTSDQTKGLTESGQRKVGRELTTEFHPSPPPEHWSEERKQRHEEMQAEIKRLEHHNAQYAKVIDLLKRSRADLTSVAVKEWEDATKGTDILEYDRDVAKRLEFARRLEAGEVDKTLSQAELLFVLDSCRRR